MRTSSRLAPVVIALALVLSVASAAPARAGREVSISYAGGADPFATALLMSAARVGTCPVHGTSVGTGCFAIRPGETEMRVRIVDVSGQPAGGTVWFYNRDGTMHSYLTFCSRAVVDLPKNVHAIKLLVAPVGGCGSDTPAAATAGRIVAYFT